MNFKNTEWTIPELIDHINSKRINLQPSYQRRDSWQKPMQQKLIDSIKNNYPLPNFFVRVLADNTFEMVDGQQRAITIAKYINREISSSKKEYYSESDSIFNSYLLNVVLLFEPDDSTIENFFYLVNKQGLHLNNAEINNAAYNKTTFKSIVNKILNTSEFRTLDIFTEKVVSRMNDSSLVEELLSYLVKGITNKRDETDKLFEVEFSIEEQNKYFNEFMEVLGILCEFNKVKAINETRYKQRNDFYTLFCFIHTHIKDDIDILVKQYKFLLFLNEYELIYPSIDGCDILREYALNCVSQSNSKVARETRLQILNKILCAKDSNDEFLKSIKVFAYNEAGIITNIIDNGEYKLISVPDDKQ